MKAYTDRAADLLTLMRSGAKTPGLKVVKVGNTDPNPITLVFEGTTLPLDLDVFEVPVNCYPLRQGDRLLAYPLVGLENGQRWAVITKLNGGVTIATMQSSNSLKIPNISKIYTSVDLLLPSYSLTAGDRVSIAAVLDGGRIKYAILEKY